MFFQSSTALGKLLQIESRSILLTAEWDSIDFIVKLVKLRLMECNIAIIPWTFMFYLFIKLELLLSMTIMRLHHTCTNGASCIMKRTNKTAMLLHKLNFQVLVKLAVFINPV